MCAFVSQIYVCLYLYVWKKRDEIDISMVIGLVMGEDSDVIEYD